MLEVMLIMRWTGTDTKGITPGMTTEPMKSAGRSWKLSGGGTGAIVKWSGLFAEKEMSGAVLITATIIPMTDMNIMIVGDCIKKTTGSKNAYCISYTGKNLRRGDIELKHFQCT